ncbi:MAG: fibronectin type III domain-containing protein [Bacteroidales bacterium]|nr:fibronectin type III domain-containing protein [Bacteroidales bacterium]
MKRALLSVLIILSISFQACEKKTVEEEKPTVKEIKVTAISGSPDVIGLQWDNIEGVFWYFVSYAKTGEELVEQAGFQDTENSSINYLIENLEAETEYDIIVKGKDYLSGGELIAESRLITISTQAEL